MAKLRCLGAVKDDLHAYAEEIYGRLDVILGAEPMSVMDFGNFRGAVLARYYELQAELIVVQPGKALPSHFHQHTDSIDILVAGNVSAFHLGRHKVRSFVRNLGLRIPAGAPHGGRADWSGVTFISCQRWSVEPSHVGLDWVGAPSTEQHRRALGR